MLKKNNVTELKTLRVMEESLKEFEKKYQSLLNNSVNGIALHEIVYDSENKPINYVITGVNPSFERIFSIKKEDVLNKTATEAYGGKRPPILEIFSKVAETLEPETFEIYYESLDKFFKISAFSHEKGKFITIFEDITEFKKAHTKRSEILYTLFKVGNEAGDLSSLLETFLSSTLELVNFDGGGIYLVNKITKIADIVCHRGLPLDFIENTNHIRIDNNPYNTIFIRGLPIFTERYNELNPERSKKWGFLSIASIPLFSKDEVIGALNIASKSRYTFSSDEKYILQTIGQELGILISKMQVEEALRESRTDLQTLFDTIEDLLFVLSLDGRILSVNPIVLKTLNYSEKEILNMTVFDVHPPDKREEVALIVKDMIEGRTDSWPIPLITKEGKLIPVETKVVKGRWGNQDVIFGISRDITARKKAEQKIKESEEKYRNAYEQANFYKDLFIHDMSNVINNIQGSLELYYLYQIEPDKIKEMNEIIEIARNQLVKITNLISTLRKLSQVEEDNGISLNKIEVIKLLKTAIKFTRESFQEKKISIDINAPKKPIFVRANQLLLDVYENLLNNAVKYNDNPKVEINVRISKEQKEGKDYVKMEFIDNGIGISDTLRKFIFQKGHREHKGKKGMGFGLSLVEQIIKRYGGQIWVEDKVPGDHSKGSNFIILIPESN